MIDENDLQTRESSIRGNSHSDEPCRRSPNRMKNEKQKHRQSPC